MQREAELYRARRLANGVPMELAVPYFSVSGGDVTTLYLISQVDAPVLVEIVAYDVAGQPLSLGSLTVEPTRHRMIDLAGLLSAAAASFQEGSLRLRFLGDAATLQGWVVLHRGPQTVEVPFQALGNGGGWQLTSFWDGSLARGRTAATYYLLNTASVPVSLSVTLGQGTEEVESLSEELAPGELRKLRPASEKLRRGWLRLRHDGAPGDLVGVGLLAGPKHMSLLEMASPAVLEDGVELESIRIPLAGGGGREEGDLAARPVLSLYNVEQQAAAVAVEIVDQLTGEPLLEVIRDLEAGAIESLDLRTLLAKAGVARPRREVRARLHGGAPFMLSGWSALATGEVQEVTFFPAASAHSNGTYPLPSLAEHEVFTTLVNLSDEEAQIGAQVFWEGGTYAYGPITVPPRGSLRIDFAALAAHGGPDLLGRTLDPEYRHGYLQWSTVGSHSERLIARTEARPRGRRDAFGFNCFGCCPEFPHGEVIPSSVSFLPGQVKSFQACEYIDTCAGTLGPYFITPYSINSPWPFSWNGSTVGASAAAKKTLSFEDSEIVLKANCQTDSKRFAGFGIGNTCKKLNPKGYDKKKTCPQQAPKVTTCMDCCQCCTDLYREQACECGDSATCQATAQSAFQSCKVLCAIDLSCDDPNFCPVPF